MRELGLEVWHLWRVIRTYVRWYRHRRVFLAVARDVRGMAARGEVTHGWRALALLADRMGDDGLLWWRRRILLRRYERRIQQVMLERRRSREFMERRRATLVLAPTYARAAHWADANGVPRSSLVWITSRQRLLGYDHTARLVVMDGWWDSMPRAEYHEVVQRLAILRACGIEEINP